MRRRACRQPPTCCSQTIFGKLLKHEKKWIFEQKIFQNSKKEEHLKILNAHPYLAIEKRLTKDSANEQNNANLDQCSDKEFEEFQKLNEEYKKKFGFPFIIAVKGKNKYEILENFKKRIKNEKNIEFEEAKNQVKKIASFRLEEIKKNN